MGRWTYISSMNKGAFIENRRRDFARDSGPIAAWYDEGDEKTF